MADKKKIVVICGPTAGGKTGLSLKIAENFCGEIISADSMQIYKNLDIGTAKATKYEQSVAKHHLIDILEPTEPYNVQLFVKSCAEKIDLISSQGKLPIVVGGTGLYIESLINGISFSDQDDNTKTKQRLKNELSQYGKEHMYSELCRIDPEYAKTVHPNNTVRVLRAIEIYRLTGKTMSEQIKNSKPAQKPYDALILGLNFHDRRTLYDRINHRVDLMINDGLLKEAEYVYKNRDRFKTCVSAIGYKEFFSYFDGTAELSECVDKLKQSSRNYAKRQLTWFNRMADVVWLYPEDSDYIEKAEKLVKDFLE